MRAAVAQNPWQKSTADHRPNKWTPRVQVRRHRRQPDNLSSTLPHKPPELLGVLRVPINNQVTLGSERTALVVDKISAHLQHPRFTWPCGDACNLHNAVGKADHEQQVVSYQAPRRPYLHREEIAGGQHLPVRLQERRPRGAPAALGCRLDAVALQHVAHSPTTYLVTQIRQCALNSGIAPSRVLLRHANDQP